MRMERPSYKRELEFKLPSQDTSETKADPISKSKNILLPKETQYSQTNTNNAIDYFFNL